MCCVAKAASPGGSLLFKRCCKLTKNMRTVQMLLGHSNLESTVPYLGIEDDVVLEISEQTKIYQVPYGCRRPRVAAI